VHKYRYPLWLEVALYIKVRHTSRYTHPSIGFRQHCLICGRSTTT
jgi:hypothetical protein